MQIEFRLGLLGLRLFKAGFGLGDILRAVTGVVLTQFVLCGFQRCLSLIA